MDLSLPSAPTLWLLFAIAAAVAEILTPAFGFIFVTAAAALAAGAAALDLSFAVQLGLFGVATALSIVFLRPRVMRMLQSKKHLPSRIERLHGHVGHVTQAISPGDGPGRVSVGGEDWAATSAVALAAGARVSVTGADGIVLFVAPAPADAGPHESERVSR